MKKVLSFIAVATLVVACGPSKADLEKKAKEQADSARQAFVADSTMKAAQQDSLNKANEAAEAMKAEATKRMADSLHQDSVNKKLIKVKK
jgi:hypothetical protein